MNMKKILVNELDFLKNCFPVGTLYTATGLYSDPLISNKIVISRAA